MPNLPNWLTLNFAKKEVLLKNLILKVVVEPPEPERAVEAREARRSGEFIKKNQQNFMRK